MYACLFLTNFTAHKTRKSVICWSLNRISSQIRNLLEIADPLHMLYQRNALAYITLNCLCLQSLSIFATVLVFLHTVILSQIAYKVSKIVTPLMFVCCYIVLVVCTMCHNT